MFLNRIGVVLLEHMHSRVKQTMCEHMFVGTSMCVLQKLFS